MSEREQETPKHRGSSTTMIVVAAGALLLIFVAIAGGTACRRGKLCAKHRKPEVQPAGF